jgi:hypothetical protein
MGQLFAITHTEQARRGGEHPAAQAPLALRNGRRAMLRWASGIMLALGGGHLVVLTLVFRGRVDAMLDNGLWAAVPLTGPDAEPTVEALRNAATFWGGPGSFAVPLILLGYLVWHLAGRGFAVPAGIGWALAAWCLVGGVLLVPSPFFLGLVPSVLIVLAARDGATTPSLAIDHQ